MTAGKQGKRKKPAAKKTNGLHFTSVDIGNITPGKTAEITPGTGYDIEGYGTMFGHHVSDDQGRFVYVRLARDFDISVRIEDIHNDKLAFTEAGLMARRSLKPSDLLVCQAVTNNEYRGEANFYTLMFRLKEGGTSNNARGDYWGKGGYGDEGHVMFCRGYDAMDASQYPRPFPHVWVRLKRVGNAYSGYVKEHNGDWEKQGEMALDLGTSPLVGMCIIANHHGADGTTRAVVKFRDLRGF
jgi:hypothetical protein